MIVLASQSPRRRQLLNIAGIECHIRVSGLEEQREPGETPEHYVRRLAQDKARAVPSARSEYVLAADTTVVLGDTIFEKPADEEDAARMLRELSGRVHRVLTGVCLRHGEREWIAVESTAVHFLPLSEERIAEYVASGEPMDKAGAYAIQGLASRFIDRVEGCYYNVVGLPVSRVCRMLAEAGYKL